MIATGADDGRVGAGVDVVLAVPRSVMALAGVGRHHRRAAAIDSVPLLVLPVPSAFTSAASAIAPVPVSSSASAATVRPAAAVTSRGACGDDVLEGEGAQAAR